MKRLGAVAALLIGCGSPSPHRVDEAAANDRSTQPAASVHAPAASAKSPPSQEPAAATGTPSSAGLAESQPERRFGAPGKIATPAIAVEQVLAAPDALVGTNIKCEGKVARVCQAAGCWLELQAAAGGEGLRVPMANHAFFIPQDAVGHTAIVEGDLKRRELPDAQRAHYEGEGMKAVGPLSLDATSVLLR